MNLTYVEYDVSKENVGQTLEFLASEHERIVHNLRVMLANRDGLLKEKDAENVALQAWKDAVPTWAIAVTCDSAESGGDGGYEEYTNVREWLKAMPA